MSMAKHILAVFLHLSNSMSCHLQPVLHLRGSRSNVFYFPPTFNVIQTKENSSGNTFFTASGTMLSNHISCDFPNGSDTCMSKDQPVPPLNRLKFTQKEKGGIPDSALRSMHPVPNALALPDPFQKGRLKC